jgi:multidrug efflux pump subunit AcrB
MPHRLVRCGTVRFIRPPRCQRIHERPHPFLIASLCTLLVLLPPAIMPGLGKFLFRPMFLAVAFAMTIAYILSRTFVPARCAAWLRGHRAVAPTESHTFDYEHRNEHEHRPLKGSILGRLFEK